MKKRFLSMVLATVMAWGLAVPGLAAGPTFTDVPETHWAYADVETAAENGLMNGTGGGLFSPDMKVSVAQFLTLVGRVVFPDVKAEGEDWAGPYVTAAQEAGLLTGTQVDTGNVEAEISRYDMAVILRAAAKQLGVAEKSAQSSEVADYLDIPTRYAEAVLAVYGMGLIKGDQAGNFNGSNTMMRSEVVTVVVRLFKFKPGSGTHGGGTTVEPSPSPSVDPELPKDPEPIEMYVPKTTDTKTFSVNGFVRGMRGIDIVMGGIQVGFFYRDGRLIAQTVTDENGKWSMEITVDAADYSTYQNNYYVFPLAPFEYNGFKYTQSPKDPCALFDMTPRQKGWPLDVS